MNNHKFSVKKWLHSAAGRISVVLFIAFIILILIACSNIGSSWMTERQANNANNILFGVATNLIGIIVTVSFVEYFIDKQDEEKEQEEERKKILRYHKYMKMLIRRYLTFCMSITTRLEDREKAGDLDALFTRTFKLSDMADLYKSSLLLTEGFSETSIELFYKADHDLRDYMLKMLENIDFKYNEKLADLLQEYTVKSVDFDMSGQMFERAKLRKYGVGKKDVDLIEKMISDESKDWLGKFKRGELKGNLMMPYVLLYYAIQDQIRMIKKYTELIGKIESEITEG